MRTLRGPRQGRVPAAVLFDRDGTLVVDVPYCADPELVEPMPSAAPALARLRARGIGTGVITNQSGVGRGLLTLDQVARVNARVDELLGPFRTWQVCPHAPEAGCACRKPAPGLVLGACAELGVTPEHAAVIGDIESDLLAARAAGARAVLVPTEVTRRDEVRRAPCVGTDLTAAVDILIGPEAAT